MNRSVGAQLRNQGRRVVNPFVKSESYDVPGTGTQVTECAPHTCTSIAAPSLRARPFLYRFSTFLQFFALLSIFIL